MFLKIFVIFCDFSLIFPASNAIMNQVKDSPVTVSYTHLEYKNVELVELIN